MPVHNEHLQQKTDYMTAMIEVKDSPSQCEKMES